MKKIFILLLIIIPSFSFASYEYINKEISNKKVNLIYDQILYRNELNPWFAESLIPKIENIKQIVKDNPEYYYVFDSIYKFIYSL